MPFDSKLSPPVVRSIRLSLDSAVHFGRLSEFISFVDGENGWCVTHVTEAGRACLVATGNYL